MSTTIIGFNNREAVRVKVKKCEPNLPPEWRKFSVDPQITTLEVLYSILVKAFDVKSDFSICYKTQDPSTGLELFLAVLSDFDLDAAFLRAHNYSIINASDACLNLRIDIKPFSEVAPQWDGEITRSGAGGGSVRDPLSSSALTQSITAGQRYVQNRLPGLIMNHMEKTLSIMQRAFNFVDEQTMLQPPRHFLTDLEFRGFLDSVGRIVRPKELRRVIYLGGIDPSLRRVVWKHILNVYPDGMTGKERMDYMKRKAAEYYRLRDVWRTAIQTGCNSSELAYVTSMVRKDVLRTDRLHAFYAGHDDNQNIASLFNVLTTYALNHPAVSYCQGMSDMASPILVTMTDEAQAYICFCGLMRRLHINFMLDGISMTQKFAHLSEALQFYDPEFYDYLRHHQADDLLFCYRWLLLDMKREFAFDDSLRMLEVLWSSLDSDPPAGELRLALKPFEPVTAASQDNLAASGSSEPGVSPRSPNVILRRTPRDSAYTKICALRRQSSALSLASPASSVSTAAAAAASVSPGPKSVPAINGRELKLGTTKRLNQSLDDSKINHHSVEATTITTPRTNTSLDEQRFVFPPVAADQQPPIHPDAGVLRSHPGIAKRVNTNPFLSPSPSITSIGSGGSFGASTGTHFRDLKERLTKNLASNSSSCVGSPVRGQKVVKNFNEFLNFTNRSKHKAANNGNGIAGGGGSGSDNQLTGRTTSSSVSESGEELGMDLQTAPACQRTARETPVDEDNNSPDDVQDYYPMTTSMTRELRLEMENLDRQVFGADFQMKQMSLNCCDTGMAPLSGGVAFGGGGGKTTTTMAVPQTARDEVAYTKLGHNSVDNCDDEGTDDDDDDEGDCNQIKPYPGSLHEEDDEKEVGQVEEEGPRAVGVIPRKSNCSVNSDVFIWENPLLQNRTSLPSPTSEPVDIVAAASADSRQKQPQVNMFLDPIELQHTLTNSCEEASEMGTGCGARTVAPVLAVRVPGTTLPGPEEFGGGSPFLMFLSLTLLLQHRDYVMKNGMDYNEMAMHFDKMVRKHNVIRTLNQARRMYADYLEANGRIDSGTANRMA